MLALVVQGQFALHGQDGLNGILTTLAQGRCHVPFQSTNCDTAGTILLVVGVVIAGHHTGGSERGWCQSHDALVCFRILLVPLVNWTCTILLLWTIRVITLEPILLFLSEGPPSLLLVMPSVCFLCWF